LNRVAITVEDLSKAYHIGLKENRADTLVGALHGLVHAPLKNFRHLARMNTFRHQEDAEDIFWALREISFEIAEGEVVGIIGRNGAGKSTLLKILSRITEPTTGRAVIRGRVSSLLEVGTGFHQELTGRENVYMNGTILGMTKREIDGRFDEIVAFSGVERFLDTAIKHYSSGMKVRLAFSVAAHLEPEILIIDEVLAVGDVAFQKKCMGKMNDVARGGRTVLFVSHNMAAVEAICSRGIELSGGRIVSAGSILDVISDYRARMYSELTVSNQRDHLTCSKCFREVELLDDDAQPLAYAEVGRPIQIRIHLAPHRQIVDARIRISIYDLIGNRLLMVQTPANASAVGSIERPTVVVCRIPEFPLAPGNYAVGVSLADNREMLDEVKSVCSLSVENAELFGEGRGFTLGMVAARSEWKVASRAPVGCQLGANVE